MNKWLKVGGALLLLAWGPFLYAELTSDPAPKKTRVLPAEQAKQDEAAAEVHDDSEAARAGEPAPAPVVPAPAALEAKAAPIEPAEPSPAVPPEPPATPVAAVAVAARQPVEPEKAVPAAAEPALPPPASGPAALLKRAFDTEPRDPLWAADTESRIQALFATPELSKDLLRSATCRKAVCRVELQWSSERASSYDVLQKAVLATFDGAVGVEPLGAPDDKGELQVNLYLPRKGYTVADLAR